MALSRAPRISTAPTVPKNARQTVPAFLQKLYEMLNNPSSQGLIRWSDAGDSFFVLDHEHFAREILPRWFKHQNFASFVRQLNMYGFHKIPHLHQGVLRSDTSENEYWNFSHENFRRDQPDLLCLIHRKKGSGNTQQQQGAGTTLGPEEGILDVRDPNTPSPQSSATAPTGLALPATTPGSGQVIDVNAILQGIAAIKKHQTTISEDLQQLKQSNQLLWQDAMAARERLQKNEDTVQRIVKFLAGVFGNRRAEGGHPGHEHAHPGHHGGHDGKEAAEDRHTGAVVPLQRRSGGTPGAGAGAGGRRPRLMIEGAKDPLGKGSNGVGIVEVGENDPEDVVNIIVDDHDHDHDNGHDDDDEEDDRATEMTESNLGGSGSTYNNIYAVETPASVPSPSPSIAQSDTAGPTIADATSSPNISNNPSFFGSSSTSNDSAMPDVNTQSSSSGPASTSADTSTSAALDRAVTPSRLTSSSPFQLQSALNSISNLTPEQLGLLLSFFPPDSSSTSSMDPTLGFPSHSDNAGTGQLTFAGGAPSPPTFDLSSLGGVGSPAFSGFSSGANSGFPALLTGSPAHNPSGTASNPPGSEHLYAFEPDGGDTHSVGSVLSPRLDRHWRDVRDVNNDVAQLEDQVNHLIEPLGFLTPYLNMGSVPGLGSMAQGNDTTSTSTGINSATNDGNNMLPNASSSNPSASATTQVNSSGDADTDISSLDPTHLSIPTGLENTDFNFHSFFPSSSTHSTSSSTNANNTPTSAMSTATPKPGVIDSTMDMNFDMGDISGIGGISSYNDLNSGPETSAAFLSEVPSPAPSTTSTLPGGAPGSPVQSTRSKPMTTTTTTKGGNVGGVGRKRKSDAMAMGDLEGALMGTTSSADVAGKGGSAVSGGEAGTKVKRRKD